MQEYGIPVNDKRILVINVDDRESDPPSDKEIAQIKSFVREAGDGTDGLGARALVVWPETSRSMAETMARDYEQRAGSSPVEIPVKVEGPRREAWPSLAVATLKLVNSIEHLEDLGVRPENYDTESFTTVGDFLDQISSDFVSLLDELLKSTRIPVRLVVVFASESGNAGILSQLTSGYRYGLVDADKLVAATPASSIGRWWSKRMGLLIQTIVRLDARVVFAGPSLIVPVINRYGPDEVRNLLVELGNIQKPPSEISSYFERSDFGKLLQGTASATAESRGNPAVDATAAYGLVAEQFGFTSGRDKRFNRAFGDFLAQAQPSLGEVVVESKVDGTPLIPDISLKVADYVSCVEFHWRSGDYLVSANRSAVAQYVLTKLKAYATELGWTSE